MRFPTGLWAHQIMEIIKKISRARKPWSANRELRGWQRRGCRDKCQEQPEKAQKHWIRGKNRAQTVNSGGAKPWSANRELGTLSLQNSSVSVHNVRFMVYAPLKFVSKVWQLLCRSIGVSCSVSFMLGEKSAPHVASPARYEINSFKRIICASRKVAKLSLNFWPVRVRKRPSFRYVPSTFFS